LEVRPSLYFGGKYPNSPLRHRNANKETITDFAKRIGYPITENPMDADICISMDYNVENEDILRARKKIERFNVLFRNEPRCVLPAGYSRTALGLNNHIITFGKPDKELASEVWPQFWDEKLITHETYERNNVCAVIVNANKLNLAKSELYTLRRKCIKRLNNLDVYGEEWNTFLIARIKVATIEILKNPLKHSFTFSFHSRHWFSRWPLIVAPEEKNDVLGRYKISLVIENELTYLSEKLFDALAAGCIPVYVGPDVNEYGIPRSLVFQAEPNLRSIKNQINLAIQSDYPTFQRELAKWLNSSLVKARHQGEYVMTRALENCVEEFLRVTNLNRK
jgi:hypothetical protein